MVFGKIANFVSSNIPGAGQFFSAVSGLVGTVRTAAVFINKVQQIATAATAAFNFTKGIDKKVNGAILQAIDQVASGSIDKIDFNCNSAIDRITKSLIVPTNNPINLKTGDLSINDFTKRIDHKIGDSLATELGIDINTKSINNVRDVLTDVERASIQLNQLQNVLEDVTGKRMKIALPGFIENFSGDVLSGIPSFPTISNIEATLRNLGGKDGLQRVNEEFDNSYVNLALKTSENFEVKNDKNIEKFNVTEVGAKDPDAEFPNENIEPNESEVDRLARGQVIGTVVQKKDIERMTGAQLPNNETFDQPPIPYNARYPHNKVFRTKTGHIVEFDDTPNLERIHIYHKTGTFFEIDHTGSLVTKVKGSSYKFTSANENLQVVGDGKLSIGKGLKIFVGGHADIEVTGDTNLTSRNDINIQSAGRLNLASSEELNLRSANVSIQATNAINMLSTNTFITAVNEINTLSSGDSRMSSLGTFSIGATNGNNINLSSGKGYGEATGEINLNNRSIEASTATAAHQANVGIGLKRETLDNESILDPSVIPYTFGQLNITAEDSDDNKISEKVLNDMIEVGIYTQKEADAEQFVMETDNPTSSGPDTIVQPSIRELVGNYKDNNIPTNLNLSPNFSVASLSTKAIFPHKVKAQAGLTIIEILENMQGVALNILEPLLSKFPTLIITSGFRDIDTQDYKRSQHCKGQAVDIQIKGAAVSEYFGIAQNIANIVNYDQLLLEYQNANPTGYPWIHISFNYENNRRSIFTYNNQKKFSSGLSRLA